MRFSLFGSYGEKNIGDESICIAVVNNILKIYKDSEIVIFSHDVNDTENRFKDFNNIIVRSVIASGFRSIVRQIKSNEFKESINLIKNSDFIIIGGGGLFYDREVNVQMNPIFVWLIRIIIFKYIGSKVVIYGIGVGPVKSYISKIFLKIIGSNVDRITVRDFYSLKVMRSCNIYTPIVVTADPVWTYEWQERSMQDISNNPLLRVDGKRKIGIQIRKIKGIREEELIRLITNFIDRVVEKYLLSVVLIPMSLEKPDDRLLMTKIQMNSRYESNIEIYDTIDYLGLVSMMQECDLLLLARMHSMIIATQVGVPFIALSYSPKTDDLIKRLDIGDYSWPIKDIETVVLERLYLKLMKKKVTIRKLLLEKAAIMKKEAEKNLNLLKI